MSDQREFHDIPSQEKPIREHFYPTASANSTYIHPSTIVLNSDNRRTPLGEWNVDRYACQNVVDGIGKMSVV